MIDLHNYMLAVGIGNIAFAVLILVYMRSSTASAGLRTWMLARTVFGLTQLLAWARPQAGLPLLVAVESAGWVIGLTLEAAAYMRFFGYSRLQHRLVPAAGLGLLLAWASPLTGMAYEDLVAYVSLLLGGGAFTTGFLLVRSRLPDATALQRLIGVTDITCGATLIHFASLGITGLPVSDGNMLTGYVAGYLLLIVNGFGFILMSKQRDDARMERLATTDDLTGLLNRRAFFARAEAARLLALRQQQPIALLMLDIDHFKQLNDRFGHATGDEALVKFAATCNAALREHDILGRLGGEEFALALPGTDQDGALHAAERLRQGVAATRLLTCGNDYTMTVSIGLVVVDPGEDLPTALARADHALYDAKRNGRNRVEVSSAGWRRA
ncbi:MULTISPECIES: diguanylate cyclase [unclassified Massilia]|uniref:GGDEF domain-containing protein n=1 Tax=unclassified Massilia TaxID=2609279 RepID=UPI0017866EA6|nr:diguanylate cyclase [Massilia sp. CFBP 13647]MBD8675488.1 diguanylate cyclase [Massilia sp. CFBP 13721]